MVIMHNISSGFHEHLPRVSMLFYQELLWWEGGLVLPVVGLVHISPHPTCCHWINCLPLRPQLLQHITPHVGVSQTSVCVCVTMRHFLCTNCSYNSHSYCVVEQRFVNRTLSCVHFVTKFAKCGNCQTRAHMPRYISMFTLKYLHGNNSFGTHYYFSFLCTDKPVVWQ